MKVVVHQAFKPLESRGGPRLAQARLGRGCGDKGDLAEAARLELDSKVPASLDVSLRQLGVVQVES